MAWSRRLYVPYQNFTELSEGDEIYIDLTDCFDALHDMSQGVFRGIFVLVAVNAGLDWRNEITGIERNLCMISPCFQTVPKAPVFQQFRTQLYGPYVVNNNLLQAGFIYPDVLMPSYVMDKTREAESDESTLEEEFPPEGIKTNGNNQEHQPLNAFNRGFLTGLQLDDDAQIEKYMMTPRLVLKHKSYIGANAEIADGFLITVLQDDSEILVDFIQYY